jgi:hypothetical protein
MTSCSICFSEDLHIEFTANYWPLMPSGYVQPRALRVDLRSDLGMQDRQSEGFFKVVFKPGKKHRINFEMIPARLNGENTINRTIEFGGNTYPVEDRITSEINVNYFSGGYQYDFVSNKRGHFGLTASLAYLDAEALVTSQTLSSTGTLERKVPLPLIGGEFRFFPIPGRNILNVNGEVKGLPLGSYGSYFQVNGNVGVAVTRFVRVQGGFNLIDTDVHKRDRTEGFNLRFSGPVFSVQLHD